MPELPEVETIVRYLRPRIRGKRILEFYSNTPRLFRHHRNPAEVEKAVGGRVIEKVRRLGKNIIFQLSGGRCLVIHLMMTGAILLNPREKRKHDRMVLRLSGNTRLVFNDIRKFGTCRVVEGPEALVGPDAFSVGFTKFKDLISSRRGAIKSVLLNQRVVAGIGNIYADEILWYAGIRPTRKADSLCEEELRAVHGAMQKVLKLAIKKEGTSMRDYRKPDDSEGGYYGVRKAYQREGEKCSRDGAVIKRIVIGQRSTHYCPRHQL